MQRMLVGLVIVLTAAVGALGVATLNLYLDSDQQPQRKPVAPMRSSPPAIDPVRVERLEESLSTVLAEKEALRRQLREVERQLAALRDARPGVTAPPPSDTSGGSDGGYATPFDADGRARNPDGSFVITDDDEEFYRQIQERIRLKQRIDGATLGVMRRVDRLAENGEIGALAEPQRDGVEKIVRRFVTERDTMVARYLRSPDGDLQTVPLGERRTRLVEAQKALVADIQRELEPLIGPEDARRVADGALATTWGLKRSELSRNRFGTGRDR